MFAKHCRSVSFAAGLVVAGLSPAFAQAPAVAPASAAPLSVEDIWKSPQLSGITLSRDGKYMAATAPVRGRMNLVVIELETRKALALTGYEDFDVLDVRWVGNSRLLYSLGQFNSPTGPGQFDGGGLFMVSRDGKESRRLSLTVRETRANNQYVYRGFTYFRSIPGSDEEIIASGNLASADSRDLYRLNIVTGRSSIITAGRPSEYAQSWILDRNQVPRVLTAGVKDKLTRVVWYRKDDKSDWVEIARFEANKGPAFVPLAFESDNKTLQVAYNGGRDTMAVMRYDPEAKKFGEVIAQHPRFDMGADATGDRVAGVITEPETDRILGYSVAAAKPEAVWLDPKYAALQAALDRHMPNRINSFRRTPDGKRWLVTSYSDTVPPRWYLFDDEKKTIEEIGSSRPWLEGKLVEQRPFLFKTRDGLEIPGYYFLPKGYKAGTKLPTIVHIHGGPFARADFFGSGFGVREGQLFASRGYAVIVPNFRITPGLGSRIYYSGFGTYGRQMSDDHEDALKWGIAEGFVDPARVCMSGASYGGYAALQAMVRSPDMWKCAVAGLAVTDLKYQLTTVEGDTSFNEGAVNFWKSVLGEQDLSSPVVREISPVFHAAKINRPVFLYAGQNDIRVPLPQIRDMASNLESAGNAPKAFVIKADEGHGFGKLENNVDTWTKILDFLKANLGP
jgi:dipeptidyl aminopeptidase/acylaminoacyl peptidase